LETQLYRAGRSVAVLGDDEFSEIRVGGFGVVIETMLRQGPTERFSSRVEHYVRFRPGYPKETIAVLRDECGLTSDSRVADIAFGTGLFTSSAAGRSTQGTNLYVGRRIGRRIEVNTNWFESKAKDGESSTILSGTVRESFSSRFSLLQLISRTDGQTTFAFGGDFTSNRLMLRADYQNVYLPFRPDRPFEQALALNVALRVAGPLQLTAASNVAPDGHLRYSFGASTYLYRFRGMMAAQSETFSIAKYVVQGIVKDGEGNPVEGAALHIGKEVVYSDSAGRFLVRLSKHGPFAVSVAPEEFITNGVYEAVSAPAEVRAETEDAAGNVEVVIRRVPTSQPNVSRDK